MKVLHGGETGKVNVTVQTEEYGRITAKFSLKEQNLTGYIACESAEGTKWLQGRQENLESALTGLEKDREVGSLVILQGGEIGGENYKPEEIEDGSSGEQTAQLYGIAKAFITVLTA